MACGTDIVTPDPDCDCHSCPPVGFPVNSTAISNSALRIVVSCYEGGNLIWATIPEGVYTASGLTQEEVDAAATEYYEALARLELDCGQPAHSAVETEYSSEDLPSLTRAYIGGAWFGFPTSEEGSSLPDASQVSINPQFRLSQNRVCYGGPVLPPFSWMPYCPSATPSLSGLFDTRPVDWETRGSARAVATLWAPVFGWASFSGHSFFYGAAAVPAASADEAFNVRRVGYVSSSTDTSFAHATTEQGPDLFLDTPVADSLIDDLLPATRVTSCQGHDGELYAAVEDAGSITVRSVYTNNDPLPPTYAVDETFAGYSPVLFTSRVFTGRESNSDTYCYYTDADGERLYFRVASDNFATETDVLLFPSPVSYLQGMDRVGNRLLLWAMTRGEYIRDVRQMVLYSDEWEDESIKQDLVAHDASVLEGTLYQSVFEVSLAAEGAEHAAAVVSGSLLDDGARYVSEPVQHYAGVASGEISGVFAVHEFSESAASRAGVTRGIRHSADEATLEYARHYAGVMSGERV